MSLSTNQSYSSNFTLQRWEEAGQSLAGALSIYLESCLALDSFSPLEFQSESPLTLRIDASLNDLHAKLTEDLGRSGAILARIRNRTSSRAYTLPEEIISEIFMNVVYAPGGQCCLPMAKALRNMFSALSSLLSVCSAWRKIGLRLNKRWSFITSEGTGSPYDVRTATFLIPRGPHVPLSTQPHRYLATILSEDFGSDLPLVDDQVSQFSSINVESGLSYKIGELFEKLLESQSSLVLSQLSIHRTCSQREQHEPFLLTSRDPVEFSLSGRSRPVFRQLLRSVSTLRLRGIGLQWGQVEFSSTLVEFRLQSIAFGQTSQLIHALKVLESAVELRYLSLISLMSFDPDQPSDTSSLEFVFPKLQSLLLEDLTFDTLRVLLTSVVGPYELHLFLTPKSMCSYFGQEEPEVLAMTSICDVLRDSRVDTLLITGPDDGEEIMWMDNTALHEILSSLPSLKTLKMALWDFGGEDLMALERPRPSEGDPSSGSAPFPSLARLCIIEGLVRDTEALRRVVASHPLQEMELGGDIQIEGMFRGNDEDLHQNSNNSVVPIQEDADIVQWLRSNVPHFRLAKHTFQVEEFNQDVWQLW